MATEYVLEAPEDVASRVLRRVHVSKMTRALQDRLALANVKIQHGWENMSLDVIEPKIEESLQVRKRPASSNETISDAASTTSSIMHSSRGLSSSPLTAPMFSDDLAQSSGRDLKRIRSANMTRPPLSTSISGNGRRRGRLPSEPWKKTHNLPESSPIKQNRHSRIDSSHLSNMSFASETSTVADDLRSPDHSEDDDADLPIHSFSITSNTRVTSSPPRTPSPARRSRKMQNVSWSRTPKTGEEGVDLLIYLATSPSAGNTATQAQNIQPPSTPPHKSTPLPSSHMTPGTTGHGFLGFGPVTPGTNFNFADFVNVTPSPAQGAWTRTPIAGRTPGASARRKLNFDNLIPPSPSMTRHSKDGLGMELGGELVS